MCIRDSNKPEYSGHRTIRVQEFDVNADKTVGPRKILVNRGARPEDVYKRQLEKNLGDIMGLMAKGGCDVAFVVDPDVDRLAMICEDGKMYGEEYTLSLIHI